MTRAPLHWSFLRGAITAVAIISSAAPHLSSAELATVTGKVVDERGKPIAGVHLLAHGAGRSKSYLDTPEVTGADGAFELSGVLDGSDLKYRVQLKTGAWTVATRTSREPLVLQADVDRCSIQGIWRVSRALERARPARGSKSLRLFIEQGRLSFMNDDGPAFRGAFSHVLDPSSDPAQIVLSRSKEHLRGIYSVDGDSLTICLNESTDEFPTAFLSLHQPPNQLLLEMKRDDGREFIGALAGIDAPEHARVLQALLGMTVAEFPGNPLRDACDYLSEVHAIPIRVAPDVAPDTEVRVLLNGASFHSALIMLLAPVGLTYELRDGTVLVKAVAGPEVPADVDLPLRLVRVETELQRRLLGENVDLFVVMTPESIAVDGRVRDDAPGWDILRQALVDLLREDQIDLQARQPGVHLRFVFGLDDEDLSKQHAHFQRRAVEVIRETGCRQVAVVASHYNRTIVWSREVAVLGSESAPESAEAPVTGGAVRVYPVGTPLGRYLTDGADCYVEFGTPLDQSGGVVAPEDLEHAISLVTALKLPRRERILFQLKGQLDPDRRGPVLQAAGISADVVTGLGFKNALVRQ